MIIYWCNMFIIVLFFFLRCQNNNIIEKQESAVCSISASAPKCDIDFPNDESKQVQKHQTPSM